MRKCVCLILVIVLLLTGCSSAGNSGKTERSNTTTQTAAKVSYPMTVTDAAGRSVQIEKEPERIVSGYYISTSTLLALGLGDKIVGVEDKPEKRKIYSLCAPNLLELPTVGSVKEFNLEVCLAQEPDLVVLPMKLKNIVEDLEKFDVTVVLVNPESQELVLDMIELLASATNTMDKGEALKSTILEIQQTVHQAVGAQESPSVYLGGNSSILSTAGPAMYQASLIEIAGGMNVAEEITDTYWAEISYEQLLKWDPDYIVLAAEASYTIDDVLNDAALAGCTAVINQHVLQIPKDIEAWDSPVPSGILGAAWLASQIHGEQIKEEEVDVLIYNYYREYYEIIVE